MGIFNIFKYLDLRYVGKKAFGGNSPKEAIAKVTPYIKEQSELFVQGCHDAREKLKDIPGTNYKLGISHMHRGNISDAILRFRMVSFLTPENPDAHYNLGRCFIMAGENDNAKKQFEKTIQMKKNYAGVQYQIDKLEKPESINNIPADIITEKCESIAESYNEEAQENDLNRSSALVKLALANIEDKNPNLQVLDLGCGTGICGEILFSKEVTKNITGVDLCPEMLKATKRIKIDGTSVYDFLEKQEINDYLSKNKKSFDLIISDDAFHYLGDMEKTASMLKKSLNAKSILAFTARENLSDGYKLDISKDKFDYSSKYIKETLKKAGFEELQTKELEVTEGSIYNAFIFKKK